MLRFERANEAIGPSAFSRSYRRTANNVRTVAGTASALFTTVSATQPTAGATFDWAPVSGSAAACVGLSTFTGAVQTKAGTFVAGTAFRGAADPAGPKWWNGWTTYAIN